MTQTYFISVRLVISNNNQSIKLSEDTVIMTYICLYIPVLLENNSSDFNKSYIDRFTLAPMECHELERFLSLKKKKYIYKKINKTINGSYSILMSHMTLV